ncbi:TKL protein kinase [Saprolegnia diclina VS20]|uniref:TKL protein kinase n=1 Tax=Saprolegnia diclina (strain VS20) TaxID=1156394 RepID=T0R516_SAPDV|nr:TKL protein kinase [Saprolegnia diclina VS20]EQC42041.1 TKL protein kinase [Saprolegnia diclina VS20]|eukprot:XP_008604610.1 TKL protein kinase [Saprolegnia diclina VS20]
MWVVGTVVVGVVVVVVSVILSVACCRQRPAPIQTRVAIPHYIVYNPPPSQVQVAMATPIAIAAPPVATTSSANAASSISGIDPRELVERRELASGVRTSVFACTYRGTTVAVKSLKLPAGALAKHRFLAECHLLARMQSPHIVSYIGVTTPDGLDRSGMLVTEYLGLGDLRNFVASVPLSALSWRQKLEMAHDIVLGLVYLHASGVLHRNLTSRNVLVTDAVRAKLSDMSVAREMDEATMTAGIGTYRWMAPEMLQDGHYATSADMFSFGVLLSELDTHQLPYADHLSASGRAYTEPTVMVKAMTGEFRPTFSYACPRWFSELGAKCMASDPQARPTAMEASYAIELELQCLELSSA